MDKVKQAIKKFAKVRDSLNNPQQMQAYRAAHFKPLKFYIEHSKREAITILLSEVQNPQ